jgi:uncharacterized protein (TIGR03435 family)
MTKRNAILLLAAVPLLAQTAGAPVWKEFSLGPSGHPGGRYGSDGIRGDGVPIKKVLSRAYGLPEHRIVGPAWVSTERYALTAVVSNPDDFPKLMQQELADRFQLQAHLETKEIPVYVLKTIEGAAPTLKPAGKPAHASAGMEMTGTLASFAKELSDYVQRPVFDETQIAETLHVALHWPSGDAVALHAAVKDQLGLQLVDETRPIELLILDHIERPTFPK